MIRELDPRAASDDELLAIHRVESACLPELLPGEPGRSADEAIAFYRFQPVTHTTCLWVADGGFAALYVHGPSAAFADVQVAPERRRRGLGRALAESVVARARELGATHVHGGHKTPAGAAFAHALGATDGRRIVRSLLDLRDAELPEPAPPEGWRLVTFLDHVPDEHLHAYVRARLAMDDAPAPDDLDYPSWDAETVRASEQSLRERDREMRVTVALRDDGEIGSFTELRLSRGSTSAFTDDTGTVAEHRGQGLARAVKLESLRLLRADHPEVELVATFNDEENEAMLGINRSLGFRATSVGTTATLAL